MILVQEWMGLMFIVILLFKQSVELEDSSPLKYTVTLTVTVTSFF